MNKEFYYYSVCIVLSTAIGVMDYLVGHEMSVSLFYLIPVSLSAWYLGKWAGLGFSFLCALFWSMADYGSGHIYSHEAFFFWNGGIRLGIFITVATLVFFLKKAIEIEREASSTDFLTRAKSSRFLYKIIELEINRMDREYKAFSLIFIDLDHFKAINDVYGHQVGDDVLCEAVDSFKYCLRKTDVVGRLGGDEFVIFLPHTDEEKTHKIITKILNSLKCRMNGKGWNITASAGVITCCSPAYSVGKLVDIADKLMYEAKQQGGDRYLSKTLLSKHLDKTSTH